MYTASLSPEQRDIILNSWVNVSFIDICSILGEFGTSVFHLEGFCVLQGNIPLNVSKTSFPIVTSESDTFHLLISVKGVN